MPAAWRFGHAAPSHHPLANHLVNRNLSPSPTPSPNDPPDTNPNPNRPVPRRILVCGATGYVGARLVRNLLTEGHHVRCFVRQAAKLENYPWRHHCHLEVIEGDLENPSQITEAIEGIEVAYYLVHSMIVAGDQYERKDRLLAENFVAATRQSNLSRIIYLGGLGETGEGLSTHLKSRREVADILRSSPAKTTVFRAAMIIGSGSASFEILRYLVERLPIMVTPIWVQTETQPIAIRDVLRYMVQCLDVPQSEAKTIDIGCPEVVTYRHLFDVMADELQLKRRLMIPIPILSPRLSSYWIGYVTPVSSSIARPLAEGLKNKTVCRNDIATDLMPGPLWTTQQAIEAAVGRVRSGDVETRWSNAGVMPGDPDWAGGTTLEDRRETMVDAPPELIFAAIEKIGGRHGYWGADYLWWLRGWMDQIVGGPGLRRGRRHPDQLSFGETVDFWRVADYRKNSLLRLRAEMKLPGIAELLFQIESPDREVPPRTGPGDSPPSVPAKPGSPGDRRELHVADRTDAASDQAPARCKVRLHARFRPKGLFGLAYWYSVLPLHNFVFPLMLRGIRKKSEAAFRARQGTAQLADGIATDGIVADAPSSVDAGLPTDEPANAAAAK